MIPVETSVFRNRPPDKLPHPLSLQNAFHARFPSKSESGRCENEAFVRDFPQKVKMEDVKRSFRARRSSKSVSGRCENEALLRDLPQKVKVEDERSFRARLPSKSKKLL
jgi:hypothetical protein